MKSLYERCILGGIEVRNRFVRSATHEGMSQDGVVTPVLIKMYSELAKGEVGLIITGGIEVTKDKALKGSLSIHDDLYIDSLKSLTNNVHNVQGKVIAQLIYGGSTVLCPIDYEPIGPSAVEDRFSKVTPREMSKDDIKMVIKDFCDGTLRAKRAGFDGVQIQGGFGFLLNKFLSPYYNKRQDEYGGSIKNRGRILLEIREAIAKECGRDYPVFLKLSIDDFMNDDVKGLEFEEGREIAKLMAMDAYDAIEVTGGIVGEVGSKRKPTPNFHGGEAYFKEQTIELSKDVKVDLIATGGIRSEDVAKELIGYENINAVSFSRPFISEPYMVNIFRSGGKSRCTSCYQCGKPDGIRCVFNNK